MVDLQDLEMHKKMVAMFGPEVLDDYTRRSVQALQDNLAALLAERVEITNLVHQALCVVVDTHDENRHLPVLREARDLLLQVKILTGT
jgi:hypothetical protein